MLLWSSCEYGMESRGGMSVVMDAMWVWNGVTRWYFCCYGRHVGMEWSHEVICLLLWTPCGYGMESRSDMSVAMDVMWVWNGVTRWYFCCYGRHVGMGWNHDHFISMIFFLKRAFCFYVCTYMFCAFLNT